MEVLSIEKKNKGKCDKNIIRSYSFNSHNEAYNLLDFYNNISR